MHVVWSGVISFGLVSIPVRLFGVSEERGVSLHHVHARDGGRIRHRRFCTVDGEEVPYADVARGFDLPTGETVVLTDADFAELPLSSSRAMDVLSFADAGSVDPLQVSRSYYCQPTGDPKAYVLLREALERTGKVAMGKVAIRQRESLALLRPRDGLLILQLLLWPSEVRKPGFSVPEDDVLLRPREVEMATSYIDEMTGEVSEEETVDRYRVALEQLVEAKREGRHLEPVRAPELGPAEGLLEALRRSVEQAKRDLAERRAARGSDRKAAAAGATHAAARAAGSKRAAGKSGKPTAAGAGAGPKAGAKADAKAGTARANGTTRAESPARAGGTARAIGTPRTNGTTRTESPARAGGTARATGAARPAARKAPAAKGVPTKRVTKNAASTGAGRSAR